MNLCYVFVLTLLLSLANCASFTWDSIVNVPKDRNAKDATYQTTSDGSIHIFWPQFLTNFTGFIYQIILPDGTIGSKIIIDFTKKISSISSMAMQISDDGKHILIVYDGGLYSSEFGLYTETNDRLKKTIFIESFNGGKSWSEPIIVNGTFNDYTARYLPSIFLERDTGRVYVVYRRLQKTETGVLFNFSLCIREPGARLFSPEKLLPPAEESFYSQIGQTIAKASGERYLHIMAKTKAGGMIYTRSIDNGKTWSNFTTITTGMSNKRKLQMITDTRIIEGGIYAQYVDYGETRIMWSKDHGNNFEGPIRIGVAMAQSDLLTICGTNNKALLFSGHYDYYIERSFIKFSVLHNKAFAELPYPFKKINDGFLLSCALACRYVGSEQYSVTFIAGDAKFNLLWLARGTLKGIA